MRKKAFIFVFIFLFSFTVKSEYIVLKNIMILNPQQYGKTCAYYPHSTIVIKDDLIFKIGYSRKIKYPEKVKVFDLKGKIAFPGLTDGFAAINNQNYANAYLYCGVTSIIAVGGGRRGILFEKANPSPNLFKLEGIGENKISNSSILEKLREFRKENYKVALLMYKLNNSQLKFAIREAHRLGLSTIGELGFSNYLKAVDFGIDAFVHTTRYSIFLADSEMRKSIAREPFSDDLKSPKWRYYKWLTNLDLEKEGVRKRIKSFGLKKPVLIPTFGLLYLDLPSHKNPWLERLSILINPADVNNPADPVSGNHKYDRKHQIAYTKLSIKQYELEKMYYRAGVKYLAGSGTDVWGSMPGIFLHYELKAFEKIGLSPCEVLATATSNFSDTFGWKIGKIKEGYRADILILNKNPLKGIENLKDIFMLIHNGKIINRKNLLKVKK